MATTLEQLQAERSRLLAEQEALDREFGSGRGGKEFLTGAALQDWENRVTQNNRALSQNFKEIRAVTGQNSAQGQTADSAVQNQSIPNQPTESLSPENKNRLDKDKTGQLSSEVQQSQDPVAASKQTSSNFQNKSEENFDQPNAANKNSSVIGDNVTSQDNNYQVEIAGLIPKNVLHYYASYTYRITLFFLTAKDFNNLSKNPSSFVPKYSLISSGGGYATTMGDLVAQETRQGFADYTGTTRHPDFQTDFFIDNLSIETVVGLNAKTKASNAIAISFNITEPYGLSLLDRLLSACETSEDRSINYMTQPYLLQIDLLASPTDDFLEATGTTNNVISSKRIAIKLIEMKINPTGSGTTYAIRAIPYNHSAFDITTASLPVPVTVEAGTVGEFFSSNDNEEKLFPGQIKAEEERVEREVNKWIENNRSSNGTPSAEQIENERRSIRSGVKFNIKSLPAAYNGFFDKIVSEKKLALLVPNRISFNIPDNEIANSKIVNPADSSTTDISMSPTNVGTNKPDSRGFKDKQPLSFHAGYGIVDIVDAIISKSEYIKKQLQTRASEQNDTQSNNDYTDNNDRTGQTSTPKRLNWFKIVPSVQLNNFDYSTNTYSKSVVYSILPYSTSNLYHPNFPKTSAQNLNDLIVRQYKYLYTGDNQDIIKLDIDFNSSFYTLLTTKGDQVVRGGNDADSDIIDVDAGKYGVSTTERSFPPVIKAYTGSTKDSLGTAKATDPDEQIISDLKNSIYTSQRGDALNITMTIVGDPAFIKQDDIFINPVGAEAYSELLANRLSNNSTRPISSNGQILFDAEEVYVRLDVKNFVDINDSIGIVNKQDTLLNGRTTNGSFSGVYKVLRVRSDFIKGKFTQTLSMVRIPENLTPPAKPAKQDAKPPSNETLDVETRNTQEVFPNQTFPITEPTPVPETTPNQPSQVAQSNQSLTFSQAFAQARRDFGNKPGGVFEWRGKLYQTNYQNEPLFKDPTPVYPGANQ